ncbi:MAG TPA: hypothetical protein VFA12_04455 [Stellaceae bacterium]|nr:hypothetical protein [Stellaceae bacterium]
MSKIYGNFCAIAAAALIQFGLCGGVWAQADQGGQPPAAGGDQAAGPAGATRALEMPIIYVTGIEVTQGTLEPKVTEVRVTGLTSSQGWSNPQLVPFYYGKPADDILDLQFIATSPEYTQKASGWVPISAMFTIEQGQTFKGVRVRAGANALQLNQLPGVAQTTIKAIDCTQCIGKKFAEKGTAAAGTPNVVRAEELPRGYRVIVPSHGVAGIVHNPNRLNLILDDNNTIVMVFWE